MSEGILDTDSNPDVPSLDSESLRQLLESLREEKSVFLARVEARVENHISSCSFSDCLTLIERRPGGARTWRPTASVDYLKCLGAFCTESKLNHHDVDSALTEPVVAVVTDEFEQLYADKGGEISEVLSKALMRNGVFVSGLVASIVELTSAELPSAVKSKVSLVLLQKFEAMFDIHLSRSAAGAVKLC